MPQEAERLDALRQLNLLDTPASESFDRVTRMAAQIFGLPVAAISLTDKDRQWFKSRFGLTNDCLPRHKAPCSEVAERNDVVVIPNIADDPSYFDSPLAQTGAQFYAGVPLTTRDGFGLGSLCVVGTEPREVSDAEMASLRDLAEIVMAQIELQHAFGRIDAISGLPNRRQFEDDLSDLAHETPGTRRLAVFIDLASNDQLNQGARALGTSFIDDLVRDATTAMRSDIPPGVTCYHVGTTKFAYIARADADERQLAETIRVHIENDDHYARTRFTITPTVGVAPFILGETSASDVLRMAYNAADDARSDGAMVSIYSPSNDKAQTRRFGLVNDFEEALRDSDQLRLVYQPKIDLTSRRAIGVEALLRWNHPLLGEIVPGEFIPLVEHTGLIKATTAFVLDQAIGQLKVWNLAGLHLQMSVNISAANLEEPDFIQLVQLYLLKYQIRPEQLELEVTESAMMANPDQALLHLNELNDAGIAIAIDDFGTGHSSLAYLQRLPAQTVKIDQAFVRHLDSGNAGARKLMASMITLSQEMGFSVLAEGVETAKSAAMLEELGCEQAQGYLFARPMEPAAFSDWMAEHSDEDRTVRAA